MLSEREYGKSTPRWMLVGLGSPALPITQLSTVPPAAVLTGLILLARRNFDQHHHEAEDEEQERRDS